MSEWLLPLNSLWLHHRIANAKLPTMTLDLGESSPIINTCNLARLCKLSWGRPTHVHPCNNIMSVFKGYRGVRESVKWHLVTWRMWCDERAHQKAAWAHQVEMITGADVNKVWGEGVKVLYHHRSQTSILTFWWSLCGKGRTEQTQPWIKNTQKNIWTTWCIGEQLLPGYSSNSFLGTYVTSLSEFLSSLLKFCMYCHCSSDRLWPPM